MTSQKRQPIPPNTKGNECVLLIASDADAAARVLGELGSVAPAYPLPDDRNDDCSHPWFADEQMDVLRHDDVADDHKAISAVAATRESEGSDRAPAIARLAAAGSNDKVR